MRVLSSQATEWVAYGITATNYDGSSIDLSADVVKLAFVAVGSDPVSADWRTATWISTGVAGVLVGPDGGASVPVGVYDVWALVLDSPEHPTQKVGNLRIT